MSALRERGRGCCWWMQQGPCLGICLCWECHCQLCMAWCSLSMMMLGISRCQMCFICNHGRSFHLFACAGVWCIIAPSSIYWCFLRLSYCMCGTFMYVCTWAAGATYVHACKIDVMLHPVNMMLLVLHAGLWPYMTLYELVYAIYDIILLRELMMTLLTGHEWWYGSTQ